MTSFLTHNMLNERLLLMNTKVTVIVPVYNTEKYIHKCIQSLLAQTYKNIEIILVDDGSMDRCPQICDEYAARCPWIRSIHQKNTGVSGARNRGLEMATGTKIAFVDSDDWIQPAMIEEMVSAAEEHAADIVICDWMIFEHGEEKGEAQTQAIHNSAPMEQIRDEFLMDYYPSYMCNKLFNKDLFTGIRFPENITYYEDMYIHAELFCRCKKAFYLAKPFYCYRIHVSSANSQSYIHQKFGAWLAWQEHKRVCEKYGLTVPLRYSARRAQQAVISLLMMNQAEPVLDPEQEKSAKKYLQQCKEHSEEDLSLKHKIRWWALENAPTIACLFGRLSLWIEARKQKRLLNT